ncbi:hypothetical protein GCM10010873_25550 [Cypionkella aquatica]|uniref:N-acetyltransferase domain-containing protein n=1 Tax=Cypionkella aquatica TaxID=1756042 RepID=A0AA37U9I4_9RHOB|nr:GNAT family N-acetyltransferase [Cypionkella aquatica]GLS87581.1 hypothetical protein GCM10010873_25550 [Cypionkella aquatica]
MMALPNPIEGHNIRFRLVRPDDAVYIQGLRTSPEHGRHLSAPSPSFEAQRAWIEAYKAREAIGREYYFIIERRDDGARCGVLRLYDIAEGRFTWGSWILDANKPSKAALDSALLIYRIAFGTLGCTEAIFDVRTENTRTLAFHRRFGAVETGSDEINTYFKLDCDDFANRAPSLDKVFLLLDKD